LKEQLENFLIFGSFPEVITAKSRNEKIEEITEIVNSYLLKDILSHERIKGTRQILDLIKLIASQIGKEVSLNELALQVKLDVKTVNNTSIYLKNRLFLYKLTPFSKI